MAERELYPDGEQRRRIMDFIMAAGQPLLENGSHNFCRTLQSKDFFLRL